MPYCWEATAAPFQLPGFQSSFAKGSFTNYVMPLRWVGGQQNITIANFDKVDDQYSAGQNITIGRWVVKK